VSADCGSFNYLPRRWPLASNGAFAAETRYCGHGKTGGFAPASLTRCYVKERCQSLIVSKECQEIVSRLFDKILDISAQVTTPQQLTSTVKNRRFTVCKAAITGRTTTAREPLPELTTTVVRMPGTPPLGRRGGRPGGVLDHRLPSARLSPIFRYHRRLIRMRSIHGVRGGNPEQVWAAARSYMSMSLSC
jgi:hypothetical protein